MAGSSNEAKENQLNQEDRAVSLIHYWLLMWTPTTLDYCNCDYSPPQWLDTTQPRCSNLLQAIYPKWKC